MQVMGNRFVVAIFWGSWALMVAPWIERGREDGTVLCVGPFRFGWR
jgi:hypothetical protein